MAMRDSRVGIPGVDDFALLGILETAVQSASGFGGDCALGRASASADGTSAAMEEHQLDAEASADPRQRALCLIELPVRGEVAAVFVAVRVANDDLLQVAAAVQLLPIEVGV